MATKSFEDAVQTLKRRLSGHWEGGESDGRDEMVQALRTELGYSAREANDAIDGMIESGTLKYCRPQLADNEVGAVPPIVAPAGIGGSGGPTTPGGVAAPIIAGPGYWQIGSDENEGESEISGRVGQVRPRE